MRTARAERAAVAANLRSMGALHVDVLESRMVGRRAMAAPHALTYRKGEYRKGEYRSDQAGYEWFHELSKGEQARLRKGWFAPKGEGESPDEIGDRMPIKEWLEHTRHADAAQVVARGGHLKSDRYGGLTGRSLRKDQQEHKPNANGVRFYTNTDGEVIPIVPPKKKYAAVDYGADEAF